MPTLKPVDGIAPVDASGQWPHATLAHANFNEQNLNALLRQAMAPGVAAVKASLGADWKTFIRSHLFLSTAQQSALDAFDANDTASIQQSLRDALGTLSDPKTATVVQAKFVTKAQAARAPAGATASRINILKIPLVNGSATLPQAHAMMMGEGSGTDGPEAGGSISICEGSYSSVGQLLEDPCFWAIVVVIAVIVAC